MSGETLGTSLARTDGLTRHGRRCIGRGRNRHDTHLFTHSLTHDTMSSAEGLVPITREFLSAYYDKYPLDPVTPDAER